MLPAETFSDVVSFHGYYDLGALKLASTLLSAVAEECARSIRLFDFSDFIFHIIYFRNNARFAIVVERLVSDGSTHWICTLKFQSEKAVAEFISEAFRNCTVGRLVLRAHSKLVLNAVKVIADTITLAALYVDVELKGNVQELIDFVDSFRRVQYLMTTECEKTLDVRLKNFCRRKKIDLPFLSAREEP